MHLGKTGQFKEGGKASPLALVPGSPPCMFERLGDRPRMSAITSEDKATPGLPTGGEE